MRQNMGPIVVHLPFPGQIRLQTKQLSQRHWRDSAPPSGEPHGPLGRWVHSERDAPTQNQPALQVQGGQPGQRGQVLSLVGSPPSPGHGGHDGHRGHGGRGGFGGRGPADLQVSHRPLTQDRLEEQHGPTPNVSWSCANALWGPVQAAGHRNKSFEFLVHSRGSRRMQVHWRNKCDTSTMVPA